MLGRSIVFAALSLCLVTQPGDAVFGPETEVPPDPSFVAAYSSIAGETSLGLFASKRYVIFSFGAGFGDPTEFQFRFGALDGPQLNFASRFIGGPMPFAVKKLCQNVNGYVPISFKATDVLDYTKNNTGALHYFKMSTKKYYTRTVDILQDDLCDELGTSSDGGPLGGCLLRQATPLPCSGFVETVDGQDYTMASWLFSGKIPIGVQADGMCDPNDSQGTTSDMFYFVKMQGFRNEMLGTGVVFENA